MKVCVLVPAYNEEKTIAQLVQEIGSNGLDVIVVHGPACRARPVEGQATGYRVVVLVVCKHSERLATSGTEVKWSRR